MDQLHRTGKVITIGAIGATLVAMLLMYYASAKMQELTTLLGLIALLLILTCGQLYAGSNWARWIVGAVLVLIGILWSYQTIRSTATPVTAFWTVHFGVALFSLVFGIAILTVRHVKHFLAHQRTNRNPFVRRLLQALWLVAGLAVAIGLVVDIARLLE